MANSFIVLAVTAPVIPPCRKACTPSPAPSAKPSVSARSAPRIEYRRLIEDAAVTSIPIDAASAAGADRMDLAKLRLQWSHGFSRSVDSSLWVVGVRGFDRESDLTAMVTGIGQPSASEQAAPSWIEAGGRIGYKLTDAVTLDTSATVVSGRDGVASRVHSGLGLRFQF